MLRKLHQILIRYIIRLFQEIGSGEIEIDGKNYVVPKDVFNPKPFHTSEMLMRAIEDLNIKLGDRVLDLGTGCGILAITFAERGARVVAIDINREATRCARKNAELHGVDIDIICSDLFSCITKRRIFDVIVFNIPYLDLKPKDDLDLSICDHKKMTLKRFLKESKDYIKEDGLVLLSYSSVNDLEDTERLIKENGWNLERIAEKRISRFEDIVVYMLKPIKIDQL